MQVRLKNELAWKGERLAQQGKVLQNRGSKSYIFGILTGMTVGAFLLIGGYCVRTSFAEGAVYLRAMMPFEPSEDAADTDIVGAEADSEDVAFDDMEQRLIEMLTQEDQQAVYNVVENDERWRVVRMRVTAYCPCAKCCGKHSDGITACNHRIRPGDVFVAADKSYRFHTDMIIPGYNGNQPVEVLDRGRLIKGNRLDVFFPSHSVAKKWGTRYLDVLIREK